MILLINNLREIKNITESQGRGDFDRARITTFAAVLHVKCTRFQIIGRT